MIKFSWTYSWTECPTILEFLFFFRCTWTSTWTKCPSSLSSQIYVNLERCLRHYNKKKILPMLRVFILIKIQNIDIYIDKMSMMRAEFTINPSIIDTHMDKVSKMKMNTWTYSGTKCPSLLKYSHNLGATWTSTWTKCPSSFAKYNMQVDNSSFTIIKLRN